MVAQTSNSFFKICFVKLNQLTDARLFSTCLSTYPFTHTYLFSFSVDQRQNAPPQVNLDNGRIHTAALSRHFLMPLDNGRTNRKLLQESLSSQNLLTRSYLQQTLGLTYTSLLDCNSWNQLFNFLLHQFSGLPFSPFHYCLTFAISLLLLDKISLYIIHISGVP